MRQKGTMDAATLRRYLLEREYLDQLAARKAEERYARKTVAARLGISISDCGRCDGTGRIPWWQDDVASPGQKDKPCPSCDGTGEFKSYRTGNVK